MNIATMLRASATKRFHTMRTITENTVAEHGWGVACLVWELTRGQCSATLLAAALHHDLGEHIVGDVPAPAKRELGIGERLNALEDRILRHQGCVNTADLTALEARTLKLADCYDGMLFCVRERGLGNRTLNDVFTKYHSYVSALNPEGAELEILTAIINEWEIV